MRRKKMTERSDWQDIARANGFLFHHIDGEKYWDESACWEFTLAEVENEIEDPSVELYAMCMQLVDDVIRSQELMEKLAIPESMRDMIANSWTSGAPSLYGRFDFAYDGSGPAKLLEFNADTPTSIYETAYFQWLWLEDMIERGKLRPSSDQFNRLHEALMERFAQMLTPGSHLHFSAIAEHLEDRSTVLYLEDLAKQAGLETSFVGIEQIGVDSEGQLMDDRGDLIGAIFKLYPWEDMMREPFADHLPASTTLFVEPAWKAILSNKGILPLLWNRFTRHRNLLPAFFADTQRGLELSSGAHVRKPLFSREGADIELFDGQRKHRGPQQGYGEEGAIIQAYTPLARNRDDHAVIGSWIVGDDAVAMSIREDSMAITRDTARFVPHIISG